jgi:hypothetical protein
MKRQRDYRWLHPETYGTCSGATCRPVSWRVSAALVVFDSARRNYRVQADAFCSCQLARQRRPCRPRFCSAEIIAFRLTRFTGRLKKDFQAETQVSVEIPGRLMCFVFKGICIDPRRIYTAPILGWRVTPSADAKHRLFLRILDTAGEPRRFLTTTAVPRTSRRALAANRLTHEGPSSSEARGPAQTTPVCC